VTERESKPDIRRLALHAALILSGAAIFLSSQVVIAFHLVFLLVVWASFRSTLRQFISIAIPAGIAVATGLSIAVSEDEVPIDELYELPILTAAIIVVYFTVSRRERLTAEIRNQKDTIDEIHRASQRELQDQLLLTQRLQMNDRLNATVAHDVNNILSAMQLAAESLADGMVDRDGMLRTGRELESCVQRAGEILTDLVSTARITNRVAPQPPANLQRVMSSITPVLKRLCGDRVDLVVAHSGSSGQLAIPRLRLEQILVNLTINAVDAATNPEPCIEIRSEIIGDAALITVSDNGHGMSAEVQSHIFEPLYTSKSTSGGSGLGLFAVREFVEDASGTIRVESDTGSGTRFELRIPVIAGIDDHASPSTEIAMSPSARHLALRVLVADDDRSIREMLGDALRAAGHQVATATDGDTARSMIASADQPFDILVLDAMMPGMSGLELIHILAAERPELPILLMSGYERLRPDMLDSSQTVRFRQKPFAVADLLTDLQILAADQASGSKR